MCPKVKKYSDCTIKTGLLVLFLIIAGFCNAQSEIEGTWKLTAYGYDSGSGMNFSFVKGVDYQFLGDGSGIITKAGVEEKFKWKKL